MSSFAENEDDRFGIIDINRYKEVKKISESDGNISIIIYEVIKAGTNDKYLAEVFKIKDDSYHITNSYPDIPDAFRKSPFFIKIIGYSLQDLNGNSNLTFIIEKHANGSLRNLIKKEKTDSAPKEWNETRKLIFIYGIAVGMEYIHSFNFVQRNLQPKNIFIDEYFLPKIDYINNIEKDDSINETDLIYKAPELFEEEYYLKASDVYSFSILVHEILTGKLPKIKLYDKINGGIPKIDPNIPRAYSDLLYKCMAFEPKDRPSFKEIVSLLKKDKGFLDGNVDQNEFFDFVRFVEKGELDFKYQFKKVHIDYPKIYNKLNVDLDPIDSSLFEKLEFVDKGKFGKVYKIKEIKTNKIFAAKINILLINDCEELQLQSLSHEITILSKLKSPLVLKFIGYSEKNFNNKQKPTIITEFTKNKSLNDIIELQIHGLSPKQWSSTNVLKIIYGIASGMVYLHSKNILHRDLKPANIFIDEHLFPKIGDFGLAIELNGNSIIEESKEIGTPAFMSPEIYDSYTYSKASDVYAFGILIYQLVTLKVPFEGFSYYKLVKSVISGVRPEIDSFVSNCYKNLIQKCWSNDPKKRPSFDEIVDILENDEDFIDGDVDVDEYLDYVDYIQNERKVDSFPQISIDFKKLKKIHEKNRDLNVPILDLSQYEKKRLIRKIDNFKVYEVKNKKSNELFEAKISTTEIKNLTKNDKIHLSREINILSKLNHPSFLKFIGYSPIDFNQSSMPVIVTEIPKNKSLSQLFQMERNQHIKEWDDTKKLICIYGIASGMSYLHLNNVVHRNLNPDSIFFDDYLFPKIGNFGLLTKIHSAETMTYQTSIGIKGNYLYSSPEFLEFNEYSKPNDVYAFALIAYEIMTSETPFKKIQNFSMIFNEVVERKNRPKFNVRIDNSYRKLIELCWSQNPDERPTFEKIEYMLKTDSKFITKKIDKRIFFNYVDNIERSLKDFCAKKKVVQFDDLIEDKTKNEILRAKSSSLKTKDEIINKPSNIERIIKKLLNKIYIGDVD